MIEIYPHFSIANFSNTYLIGNETSKQAFIIDPGNFDIELLKLIEDNQYDIVAVLLTHSHQAHSKGIRTIKKIYNTKIYAGLDIVEGIKCEKIEDAAKLEIAGLEITAMAMPGHSRDSFVYFLGTCIFTGDSLEAGTIGSTFSQFLEIKLKNNVKNKIFCLDKNYFIFPGHGPCTTLDLEKKFNYSIN